MEAGAAIALVEAAVRGDASLQSNGLHVAKLAYDDIAFTILAVCVMSCVQATMLLARVAKSWNRVEPWHGSPPWCSGGSPRPRSRTPAVDYAERRKHGLDQLARDVVAVRSAGGFRSSRVRRPTRRLNPRVVTV